MKNQRWNSCSHFNQQLLYTLPMLRIRLCSHTNTECTSIRTFGRESTEYVYVMIDKTVICFPPWINSPHYLHSSTYYLQYPSVYSRPILPCFLASARLNRQTIVDDSLLYAFTLCFLLRTCLMSHFWQKSVESYCIILYIFACKEYRRI